MLDAALHDKNPDTRRQGVVALSLANASGPWVGALESMPDDKDVTVRVAVVSSLMDLKTRQATEVLRKALNDPVPEVSYAAAKALYGLDDPAGKEALLSVLAKETKASSGFFAREKRDALRLLHTPGPMFFMVLRGGAGFVPVPGLGVGVSSMHALVSDSGMSGAAGAALLLGTEKDEATLKALKEALGDKDWSVRAAAVHSLALHNDPAFRDDIFPLRLDESHAVRLRAAVAWLRLDSLAK